jgi:cytochrome c553
MRAPLLLAPAFILFLSSCGESPKEEQVSPTLEDIQSKIFNQSCTSSSCHGSSKQGGLDLQKDQSYANLVSIDPQNPIARSKGYKRVFPGDPSKSFLVHKLRGTLDPGEGSRMPPVGSPLSESKIQAIEEWIKSLTPSQGSTSSSGGSQPPTDGTSTLCQPTTITTSTPTFTDIQNNILTPRCATTFCHGSSAQGGLKLLQGQSYSNLVCVDPQNATARSKGYKRVFPGDPSKSFLVHKLRGTLDPGEGNRMPSVVSPLSDPEIQTIEQWIQNGAPNN